MKFVFRSDFREHRLPNVENLCFTHTINLLIGQQLTNELKKCFSVLPLPFLSLALLFFFIQLDPPLNRENSPFFGGKPTFRLVSSISGINIKIQNFQSWKNALLITTTTTDSRWMSCSQWNVRREKDGGIWATTTYKSVIWSFWLIGSIGRCNRPARSTCTFHTFLWW